MMPRTFYCYLVGTKEGVHWGDLPLRGDLSLVNHSGHLGVFLRQDGAHWTASDLVSGGWLGMSIVNTLIILISIYFVY